jgi:hypothetical protein
LVLYRSIRQQFREAGMIARLFFIFSVFLILVVLAGGIYFIGGAIFLGFFYPEL